jgi:hypothetical protein
LAVPEDATITDAKRRVLNPNYTNEHDYKPRTERKEWDPVGILGICRVRKGQQVAASWIKMRDVSEQVEEWFVK